MENNINLTEVVAEANKQIMMSLDKRSIKITGCDIDCTFTYSALIRNNEKGIDGRNRISLKDFCKQKNYNHTCVYNIVQGGDEENEGLEWFIKEEGSTYFSMTSKGMIDIYGGHLDSNGELMQISTPIVTVSSGSIYVDDAHELFSSVFAYIEEHPMFSSCGGYNEDVKSRELMFSRNELELADALGIVLGVKELSQTKEDT